jgi:hypothetical protein
MITKAGNIIGRATKIEIVDLSLSNVPAKIDTGADSSAIWASQVSEKEGGLHCIFFGPSSPYYSGKAIVIPKDYSITRVANSFGHKELRYKIKLSIRVQGKLIRATFTLSDRSSKTYPILLGRRVLRGKFIVDVAKGHALDITEKSKAKQLKQDIRQLKRRKEQ